MMQSGSMPAVAPSPVMLVSTAPYRYSSGLSIRWPISCGTVPVRVSPMKKVLAFDR